MRTLKVNSPGGWTRRLAPIFLIFAFAATSQLHAKSLLSDRHDRRHEIEHLEDIWRSAVLNGNIPALDSLLADDYMAITSNGVLQSKDQAIAAIRAGTMRFNSIQISDRKVRFYGTTALVTCRAEITGKGPEGNLSGSYRYTRVYVQNAQGVWHIVSFEASRIRETEEHR